MTHATGQNDEDGSPATRSLQVPHPLEAPAFADSESRKQAPEWETAIAILVGIGLILFIGGVVLASIGLGPLVFQLGLIIVGAIGLVGFFWSGPWVER